MQVKGAAVLTIPLFIKARFGDPGLQRWLARLSEPARAVYANSVLASNWYPLDEILIAPTSTMCDLFYDGRVQGAVDQGRFSAEHALRGIYKIFVKFGSTEGLVSRASTILPTYYQPSAMQVVDRSAGAVRLRITEFERPHTVVEHRIKGWMERALEISGVRAPQVTIASSMTTGSPFTEYEISWV